MRNIFQRANDRTDAEIAKYYNKKQAEAIPKAKMAIFEDTESIAVSLIIAALIVNTIVITASYIKSIYRIEQVVLTNNLFYILLCVIGAPIAWIISTNTTYWGFRDRKKFLLYLCITTLILVPLQLIYTLVWNYIVTLVFTLRPTAALSTGMILLLARVILLAAIAGTSAIILMNLVPYLQKDHVQKKIDGFKLKHYLDNRKNKENLYDAVFIKNLKTGADIVIKYRERFLHFLVNGASGTGKTSSIFLPQICRDLNKKVQNRSNRQKELLKLLLSRKAYINSHWTGKFDETVIRPVEGYEKKYEEILSTYQDCGITVIAPDNSVVEDIVKLCAARDISVNILDPAKNYANYKNVSLKGINPFYIEPGLDESETAIRIMNAATVFADVLIAVNQSGGKTDVYFTDISRSVSQNIAIVCMLYANMHGTQTNLTEIQECVSDFSKLKPYVDYIEEGLGIKVVVEETKKAKKEQQSQEDYAEKKKKREERQEMDADEIEQERREKLEREAHSKESPYYFTLLFIRKELLGEGAADMFSQSRGLRNLINNLVTDPRIKKILSASAEDRLDFDAIFSRGEITLVNTAQEFSKSISTGFGLFFLLTQRVSVLRRPVPNNVPHFMWIDEASQYMHEVYEEMIAQYRKFNVSVTIAIQSLSQIEKNENTRFLKDVFLTAGTHVAFGRLGPYEMELYSKMAGSREVELPQTTRAETSLMQDDPSISKSVRVTPTQKAYIEGSDMRLLDFQEVTVITVDDGRVKAGELGKVDFLKKRDFARVDTNLPDFSSFNPEDDVEEEKEEEKPWEIPNVDSLLMGGPMRPIRQSIGTTDNVGVPKVVIEKTMEMEIKDEDREEPDLEETEDIDLASLFFAEENENVPPEAETDVERMLRDMNQQFHSNRRF